VAAGQLFPVQVQVVKERSHREPAPGPCGKETDPAAREAGSLRPRTVIYALRCKASFNMGRPMAARPTRATTRPPKTMAASSTVKRNSLRLYLREILNVAFLEWACLRDGVGGLDVS